MVSQVPESTFCGQGLLAGVVGEWLRSVCDLAKKCWPEETPATIYALCKKVFKVVIGSPDEESYKTALTMLILDVLGDLDEETVVPMMKSFYSALSEAMNTALVKESFVDVCTMLSLVRQVNGLFVRRLKNGSVVLEQLLLESLSPYSTATVDLFRNKMRSAFGNLNDLFAINNAVLDNHVEYLVQVYEHIFKALQASAPLNEMGQIVTANSKLCLEVARRFPAEISEYNFLQIGVTLHRVNALLFKYDIADAAKGEALCAEFRSRLLSYYTSTLDEFVLHDTCGSTDYMAESVFWENSSFSFSIEMWRNLLMSLSSKIPQENLQPELATEIIQTIVERSLKTLAARFVEATVSQERKAQFKADALLIAATALEATYMKPTEAIRKLSVVILNAAGCAEHEGASVLASFLRKEQEVSSDMDLKLLRIYSQVLQALDNRSPKDFAISLSEEECLLSTLLARHFLELDSSELIFALLDFVATFEWDLLALWKTLSPLCVESQEAHTDGRGNVSITLWYTKLVKVCAKYARPVFARAICSEIVQSNPPQLFEVMLYTLPGSLIMFDKCFASQIGTFGGLRVIFAMLLDATNLLLHELESEPTNFTFEDVIMHNLKPVITDLRKIINSYDSTAQTDTFLEYLQLHSSEIKDFPILAVTDTMKNTDYRELLNYLGGRLEWLHDNLGRTSLFGIQCSIKDQWQFETLSKLCS